MPRQSRQTRQKPKTKRILIRLSQEEAAALRESAERDRRKPAALAALLIVRGLHAG
jgi:hypothetical protein